MNIDAYEKRVITIKEVNSGLLVSGDGEEGSIPYDAGHMAKDYYTAAELIVNEPSLVDESLMKKLLRSLHPYGGLVIRTADKDILKPHLEKAGFIGIEELPDGLVAFRRRDRHTIDLPLTREEFTARIKSFKAGHRSFDPVSFVVTVHNEETNLPVLMSFLDNATDKTGADREFIFVLNNCTDRSEEIVRKYAEQSPLRISIVFETEPGIVPAYRKGLASRSLNGFVGRFDADVILHPYTLDLMYMHLADNPDVRVTYAEPQALDSPSDFNQPWYEPSVLGRRLYYTGKTSLYRSNPFEDSFLSQRPPTIIADDVLTSFYYVYTHGLDAISRTPAALVYEKVAGNQKDLTRQLSRITSEITRIFKAYPQFAVLGPVMDQTLYPSRYKNLVDRAMEDVTYTDDWLRLESTK